MCYLYSLRQRLQVSRDDRDDQGASSVSLLALLIRNLPAWMQCFHGTQGYKRLLTVLLLSLNVLLSPLLEIAAHRPSFIRAAPVAIAMALRSARENRGRCYHCVFRVHCARSMAYLIEESHKSGMSEKEGQDVVEMSSDPWLTRATCRSSKKDSEGLKAGGLARNNTSNLDTERGTSPSGILTV
jgi:hypothetical protein